MSRVARVVALLAIIAAPVAHGATKYSAEPVDPSSVEGWRSDLATLLHGIERIHPDPYRKTDRETLRAAASALSSEIPSLAAHEILTRFARLLAMVGDGHTSLPLYAAHGVGFHILPYRVGIYDDGIHVEGADAALADLVGGRLVSIGDVVASEALERVTPLISRDNDNWIAAVAPHLLNRIEVLHALGMTDDLASVRLTVEKNGRRISRIVRPLDEPQPATHGLPLLPRYVERWVDARIDRDPLHLRDLDAVYLWHDQPEDDILYIRWDQVQNRHGGPSALETFREAMAFAREKKPAKTVIDIRHNPGGNGGLLPPIIREIVRTREIDEPGKLFLVIGRRTFSAAQMMTSMMEQFTSAILVGEPSGAFYTGPAGHTPVPLPHSGVTAFVSPDLYQMGRYPRDPRRQATPRVAAVPSFADYIENRDPALEAVRSYDPHAGDRMVTEVREAFGSGDEERAIAIVKAFDARPVNRFHDSSAVLNSHGYRLLNAHDLDAALAIFRLNVRAHPGYANGWDSLGEALVHAGRRDEAIDAFRRALEIDPEFGSSREWLDRLQE